MSTPARPLAPLLALVVGLGWGALTAFGQGWLPDALGSLANSVGPWALPAFLVALPAPSRGLAAFAGFLALAGMLLGYLVGDDLRGYPSGSGMLIFWGAAAVVAGPLLGIAAYAFRGGRGNGAAVGIGFVSGLLVGEGCYGLRYIAATTSPPYWWTEVAVGALLVLLVGGRRLADLARFGLGVVVTAAVAVAFVVLYAQGGSVLSWL